MIALLMARPSPSPSRVESTCSKLRREACTGVSDLDSDAVRLRVMSAHGDGAVVRCVLVGVAENIPENLLQARRVHHQLVSGGVEREAELKMSIFHFAAHNVEGVLEKVVHIGPPELEL